MKSTVDAITGGPVRPRRLRGFEAIRTVVRETHVSAEMLAMPFFMVDGSGQEQAIHALPGMSRFSVDRLLPRLEQVLRLGIRTVVLFGVVDDSDKDRLGSSATAGSGPVPRALQAARRAFGNDLVLVSDVCLCAYTDHGHCGVLGHGHHGYYIDNDATLPRLADMAALHAEAGAHIVAPSDMMDGRVAAIRRSLDAAGSSHTGILSYAVKYASAFYGPFREAAASTPKVSLHGVPRDRTSYQMDPANNREALREAALDEHEGADMLMVKPALPYLDVLARVREKTHLPLAAYQVSGEYALLKAGAAAGVVDEPSAVHESLLAIRRAGADLILSYYAVEAVEKGWLNR